MCNYEEVIEQDVKDTLRNHFGYGEASIEQFWRLEGEALIDVIYAQASLELAERANNYERLIGEVEL